jgi:hypothetical protein
MGRTETDLDVVVAVAGDVVDGLAVVDVVTDVRARKQKKPPKKPPLKPQQLKQPNKLSSNQTNGPI